jgi:UrcA family protein
MFTTARSKFITLAVVVMTGAAFLSLPAQARAADPGIPHVVVNYADLDLASQAGVSVLYRRLQSAANRVCRAFEGRDIGKTTKRRACYQHALSGAVAEVNLETLTALHRNARTRLRVS